MKQKSKNLWCRHGICFAVIGVSLIVLLIILGCFLLFRGSARLEAEIDYEPKDNITLYGQNEISREKENLFLELGVPNVREIPISKTYGEQVLRRLVPIS